MSIVLVLAVLILLVRLALAQEVIRGVRRMRRLATLAAPLPTAWPRVSIVLAARNEGTTLGAAVPTMLALDYPEFELIAVNDRSEDDTGAVLDQLAAANPRLRVVHVRELPAGWLGKNHALHTGAAQATSDWILFTDADIHFTPDALRRAVAYARAQAIDHLAAIPRLTERGHWLGICVNAFGYSFNTAVRPWRIPDPRSRSFGGVGAFNLVRTTTYRKLHGHEPVRLRPDDDMKLGKLMKAGGSSELVLGEGAVSVEWYDSVRALVHGLTKNAYAVAEYRFWAPPLAVAGLGVGYLWPVAALFVTSGPAWWLYAASVAVILVVGCDHARFSGGRWWHGLFLPLGIVVLAYALLRSQAVTIWTGGIAWRGTHYPLADLRANRL